MCVILKGRDGSGSGSYWRCDSGKYGRYRCGHHCHQQCRSKIRQNGQNIPAWQKDHGGILLIRGRLVFPAEGAREPCNMADIESEEGKWKKRKKLQDGVI